MVEQKIKFPVFNYQGLPFLFAILIIAGIGRWFAPGWSASEIIVNLLFVFLGSFGMCGFLFHRNYIIRIDSSDHIIFGQEFTSHFVIKKRKIPICDLSYSIHREILPGNEEDDDLNRTHTVDMMEIKENGKKIIKIEDYEIGEYDSAPNFIQRFAPTWKESLKSTLPELFEIEHIILHNQKLMSLDPEFNPIKTDEKPVQDIFQAEIIDGHLHGYTTDLNDEERLEAYVTYCLGLRKPISERRAREHARKNPEKTIGKHNNLTSSSIYDMVFEEDGTTRVETKKNVYRVEYKNWKVTPNNYPSNTKGAWWDEK